MRKTPLLLALALAACASPTTPGAPIASLTGPLTLLEWAPADAQAAFVVRDANLAAAAIDLVDLRFSEVPAIKRAVVWLRAWEYAGVRPGARRWGPGLDLGRGVAIFARPGHIRVVFGGQLPQALTSLAKLLAPLEGVSATADALQIDGETLRCAGVDGLVVCDSKAPPEAPPGRPAWAEDDAGAALWSWADLTALPSAGGAPFAAARLAFRPTAEPMLSMHYALRPAMREPAKVLFGGAGDSRGVNLIDARAPGFVKLGLDADALFAMAGEAWPPDLAPLMKALRGAWSGDVVVTMDGGLMHPVVLLGLKPGGDGQALVDALVQQTGGGATVADSRRPGLKVIRVTTPQLSIDLHYGVTEQALVVALAPDDVARRVAGEVPPAELGALAKKGTHGLRVGNPAEWWTQLWTQELTDFAGAHLIAVAGALLNLRGSMDVRVEGTDSGFAVVVDWPLLPLDAPGADDLFAGLAAQMRGDEFAARAAYLRAASTAPESVIGMQAATRLGGTGAGIAVVGILASVAIPAFMKYIRRSKTSEASMNVRRLFDGAVSHYADHRRFPASVARTPSRTACVAGESTKHQPQADTWSHPTWRALNFAIDAPFQYQYEFVSDGTTFTARALGDLDCDGVLSTFERVGAVDADGNVSGGAGLFTQDELE